MKNKILTYLTLAVIIATLSACEKSLEVYDAGNGLTFYYEVPAYASPIDTITISYSFVYAGSSVTRDTIWVPVETIGKLSDVDRTISIEQIETSGVNAVAGTHYIAFDDASLAAYYVVEAGQTMASIPVVLLRDASLKTEDVTLLIQIQKNDDFTLTKPDRNTLKITFSDQLVKPNNWAYYATRYFGDYGPVKHQWLIDITGNKWDYDYLYDIGFTDTGYSPNSDSGYLTYLAEYLSRKLAEYNTERTSQGLDVLMEEDGTIVSFD